MRALVQRVNHASVTVMPAPGTQTPARVSGSIDRGLLVLLGVGREDGDEQAARLWSKISRLRIFEDEAGKTNRSLADVGGAVLVVSQFTLYADCRKGNRPSFTAAGAPDKARRLYEVFCELVRTDLGDVQVGEFGAYMRVELENDGPFTVWLDTDEL